MKILIVDDSETSRLLLQTILKASGYEDLVCIDSANAALEQVRAHVNEYNEPEVDLILMDLNMPDINGLQAIKLFKSDPLFSDIPIIMVTVSDDEANLHEAFEAGAMDYIHKPVSRLELAGQGPVRTTAEAGDRQTQGARTRAGKNDQPAAAAFQSGRPDRSAQPTVF